MALTGDVLREDLQGLLDRRAELAAAGYPEGVGFPAVSLATYGVGPTEAIAAELEAELGIQVDVESRPFEQHSLMLDLDTPDMWTLAWSADYPHAHDFLGLLLLGVGFLVLAWGSLYVPEGAAGSSAVGVGMTWLVVTYFFHTVGELALSPVGLSSVTKLSPHRLVGQMMGTWFMGAALGNLVAGLIAGRIETLPPEQLFMVVASIVVGAGLLFLLFAPLINRLTHGVK